VTAGMPDPMTIRGRVFDWGRQTFVMGIVNVTPDSFSGDGLANRGVDEAVRQARRMQADGADILDIGGESTRPGHWQVAEDEELARVLPVVRAIRAALPGMPLSVDSRKVEVAAAALETGADLLNDVGGVTGDGSVAALAGARGVPYVLMHDRVVDEVGPGSVVGRVTTELESAVVRAVALGCPRASIIVDPGIGFGKTAVQNLELLRDLGELRALGRPLLLGTSRKSTIGRVLDLPADDRLEGTLATTALGIAAGVDIVRVHDVRANVRVARMSDAIIRGWRPSDQETLP
jgi:dihydropteroate synthase